jgi:pSer/pThr/pTyr-binding forkhead associated (FHA) protein
MKLVIEDDEGNRQEIPVDGLDEVTLGRAAGNTVLLPERNVSRRHARIFTQGGALLVEDLHSANGVLLNGQKLTTPAALHDGDQLRIGDYGLVLQHDTDIHRIQVVEADTVESPVVVDIHDTAPHAVAALVSEAQPRLLALNGRLQGTLWTLGRSEVRVGKDPQAELSIPQRSLADFHARLVQTSGNAWRVQELSHSGVRVNGVAYADSPLHDGDVLELGALRLRFVGPGAPAPQLPGRSGSRFPLLAAVALCLALLAFFGLRRFGYVAWPPAFLAKAQPPREEPVLEVAPATVPAAPVEAPTPPTQTPVPPPTPPVPQDALSQARAALEARDYPHALQLLNAVKDPRRAGEVSTLRKTARAEAAAGRAVAAAQREMDAGRPGAALRQLKAAHGTHAWALEAEVLRARAADALRPKSARKSAPRDTPVGEAQGWYLEGRRFYDAGRLTDAVGAFNACLEKEADFARCHLMLAASYDKLGQMDDAEQHYRRFLALTPADDPEVPRVKKVLEDSENQKKATGQAPQR